MSAHAHRRVFPRILGSAALFWVLACTPEPQKAPTIDLNVPVEPGPTSLRRLTQLQYKNSVRDLVGPEITVTAALEPDVNVEGLFAIGGSLATISPLGVERYETAAHEVAAQAMESAAVRKRLIPCNPTGPDDAKCMKVFVQAFAPRAWRRPISDEEIARLTAVGTETGLAQGDFFGGVHYAMAAILQSPNFLFRVEVGSKGRFNDWELASRLSYFLTNTTPDEELIAAAEAGKLTASKSEVRKQAARLLAKPEAREALRNFFAELYRLYELDALSKDLLVFPEVDAELGPSAREETLRLAEYLIFDRDADFRSFFTTTETFVDRRLAALYEIEPPATKGFSKVTLANQTKRRGFLGHASFLALQSHPVATSAVLRGRFVRQTVLCGVIPPPPPALNTGFADTENKPTLRERSAIHQEPKECASCHEKMDPIGLGFENFDAIGRWRAKENGAVIDPSGELDGAHFRDAWELAGKVAEHPDLGYCLTRNLFRYAVGRPETFGEGEFLDTYAAWFDFTGRRVKPLLIELASSDAFLMAGENP